MNNKKMYYFEIYYIIHKDFPFFFFISTLGNNLVVSTLYLSKNIHIQFKKSFSDERAIILHMFNI